MTAPLPTPADVAQMRERHVREVIDVHPGYGEEAWCPRCRVHWPCDAARLLARVDSLQAQGLAWVATVVERDDRLAAVLAVLDRPSLSMATALTRIRRAATGEGS